MKLKAKRLVRIDFNGFENHNPICLEELGVFADDPGLPTGKGITAHAKIQKFLNARGPVKMHLGYDNNVYPKYTVEDAEIM